MVAFIIFPIFILITPLTITFRAHYAIDEYKFKLYKVKYFWFLFTGMRFKSARTHGLILPMLIMQIQGYLFGVASLLIIWLHEAYYIFEESTVVASVIIICFAHEFIITIVMNVTAFVSQKRTKFLRKKSKEEKKADELIEFSKEINEKMREARKAQRRINKQNKKSK